MRRLGIAWCAALVAAGVTAPAAAAAPCGGASAEDAFHGGTWHAEGLERREVYRSPQRPSYTAWVGAWKMPDDSLMIGFTRAQGEADPALRERAPAGLADRLGTAHLGPAFDFWGLDLRAVLMRSTDGGASFDLVRTDPYRALYPHAYAGSATTVLADGTILRRVNGWDLQPDPAVPHTAFFQRLAPGATGWGAPEVVLDPARFTYQVSRLRHLRDGCLLALGQVWDVPAGTPQRELNAAPSSLLMLISPDQGATWRVRRLADPAIVPNEWDVAELPSGDLLAVFRTVEAPGSRTSVRRQGLIRAGDGTWRLTGVRDAPLPHSGHPELLATREGLVLHVATSGVSWTADGGRSWHELPFAPDEPYGSRYYPVALQTGDGRIHVFGHSGHDAGYGEVDAAVFHDSFRLSDQAPPPPGPDVDDRPPPARRIATTLRAAVRLDGRTVTVSGRLRRASPAGALRGPIVLRFTRRGREHRVRVPAAPRWKRTVRLPAPGRWTLRIRYAGAGRYAAATMAPAVLELR